MSEKKFYVDRVRSSVDGKKNIVVQGFAADGYLNNMSTKAAIFSGKKSVKNLKSNIEIVKLPLIQIRRRHGDIISYFGLIYVDFSNVTEDFISRYGNKAKLVVIGENSEGDRAILYKGTLKNVIDQYNTYNNSIDYAYIKDDKTIIEGWLAGENDTKIAIYDVLSDSSEIDFNIEYILDDNALLKFPECPDDSLLGFYITINGIYKKLKIVMSEKNQKKTKIVNVGRQEKDRSNMNTVSRYYETLMRNLQNYGVRETAGKVLMRLSPYYVNMVNKYPKWLRDNSPNVVQLVEQKKEQKGLEFRPRFSILVPLYETEEKFLIELIQAVQMQTYPNWELCFSDGSKDSKRLRELINKFSDKDSRIKYVADLKGPLGISSNTNQAFSIASGDYIVLGDHDDLISPDALFSCVKAMNENLANNKQTDNNDTLVDVIYTNEDKTDSTGKKRFEPNLKPKFNQELLESCNYITHMFVVRKSLVDEVGLFNDDYNGAQDYDFILRCTEKAQMIMRLPNIVYSWRINETSTAGNPSAKTYAYDAGLKALQEHYNRVGIKAVAERSEHPGYYRTRFEIGNDTKLYVAVINADDIDKYDSTVNSIKTKSDYKNIEYVRIKSNKNNYAQQLNEAIDLISRKNSGYAGKAFVLFVEAGVTMMGEDGISNMLGYINYHQNVGAIGGKIYTAGGTISHAGVILDMMSIDGWMFLRHSKYDEMFFNFSAYSALRRGVVLMSLNDLMKYGLFNERYSGEYSMIEYTYLLKNNNKKCIYDANADFQFIQLIGRDAENCFESAATTRKDYQLFMKLHPEVAENGDVYYS